MIRSRLANERGFTLVEMVISVGILGIIIGPIAAGMLFGLVNSSGTRDRVADSASAQLVSTYFPGDAQSAGGLGAGTGVFTTGGTLGCPAAFNTTDPETMRVRFRWRDPAITSKFTTVVYFTRQSSAGLELHRAQCTTGEPEQTTMLVQHLDGVDGFEVFCDGNAACPSPNKPKIVEATLKTFNPDSESDSYKSSTFEFFVKRRADS